MSDDLYELWRDDRVIEAAARGDLLELENDPAAGPLLALTEVADGRPLPRLDIDGAALVDSRRNHRYAVRSLAVAVTAVATLSTSGVAAVVTGDPLRPAKAVWHQIQDHTGLRADDAQADSGAALGGPTGAPLGPEADQPKPPAVLPASGAPVEGITARAPFRTDEAAGDETEGTTGSQTYGEEPGDDTQPLASQSDTEQSQAQEPDSADSTESSDSQTSDPSDPSEPSEPSEPSGPTDPEQQEPSDDSGSEPAPEDQPPAPDDGSGDLGDLVRKPALEEPGVRPAPAPPEDGVADHEQLLREPLSGLSGAGEPTVDGTSDGPAESAGTVAPPTLSP